MPTFNELGTITFDEFDDGDRTLRRPKFGQIRYFQRRIRELAQETSDQVARLKEEMDKAVEADDVERATEITNELREFNDFGVVESFFPWYKEVFQQLAENPLPDNSNEWPGYFANPSLPADILNHWKMRPKASGDTTQT